MTQCFTIPGRLEGYNQYINACRSHWQKGRRFKAEQEEIVKRCIQCARLKPFTRPVCVSILWVEKTCRRDPDNVFSAQKFILDALVSMEILPGDSPKWVHGLHNKMEKDKTNPRIEVRIREVAG